MNWIGIKRERFLEKGMNPAVQIATGFYGFVVDLDEIKENPVKITALSQYKLFINGRPVLSGPSRSPEFISYLDTKDISEYLRAGENVICLQVLSYPSAPADQKDNGPWHLYGNDNGPMFACEGKIGTVDLSLPESWHGWVDCSMDYDGSDVQFVGTTEIADIQKEEKNPFFSAYRRQDMCAEDIITDEITKKIENLPTTEVICYAGFNPWGERLGNEIQERKIPLLTREEGTYTNAEIMEVPAMAKKRFVLDAGKLTSAFVRAKITGGCGSKITMTYAECTMKQKEDGSLYKDRRDDPEGIIVGLKDTCYKGMADVIYEPFRFRVFRFIEVIIETQADPVSVQMLPFIETTYPITMKYDYKGSDPMKKKLYDTAFRTLKLCMHDSYEDCPYYEELMYDSDTRLEILFTYSVTDDTALPKHAIDLFASSLMPNGMIQSRFPSKKRQIIPGFSLYWVLMLEDYIRETGKTADMEPHIPIAEKIVETFLRNRTQNGLAAPVGYWEFYDWTKEWNPNIGVPDAIRSGESVLENLLLVYTLQSLTRILPLFGRKSTADHYKQKAEEILSILKTGYFDKNREMFVEGIGVKQFSQHTQIFAVLTGLVNGEDAKKLMIHALEDEDLVKCSFVFRFYLFRALEAAGMYERTEELWKDWIHCIELGCSTFPEVPYSPRSECHGWSALPLYELSERRKKS